MYFDISSKLDSRNSKFSIPVSKYFKSFIRLTQCHKLKQFDKLQSSML